MKELGVFFLHILNLVLLILSLDLEPEDDAAATETYVQFYPISNSSAMLYDFYFNSW